MSETPPDLTEADQTLRAVSDVSLRLMAGSVSKPKMAQLRVTVESEAGEYPWQSVTQSVLSEEVDPQRLVQQVQLGPERLAKLRLRGGQRRSQHVHLGEDWEPLVHASPARQQGRCVGCGGDTCKKKKNLSSPQAKNDRQTGQDARRDETRNDEKTYRATDKQVPQSCLYIPATS